MRKTKEIAVTLVLVGACSVFLLGDFSDKEVQQEVVSDDPQISETTISGSDRRSVTDSSSSPTTEESVSPETAIKVDSDIQASKSFDPLSFYSKYIEAAEAGDVESAFVLVTALQECRHSQSNEQELLENVVYSGAPEEVVTNATQIFELCQPLIAEVGDVQKEYDRWYSVIRSSESALFQIKQYNLPYEEIKDLVLEIASTEYSEKFLYQDAFVAAARLYKEFPEHGIDDSRYLAWQLLACDATIKCDPREDEKNISTHLSRAQAAEVFAIRNDLADAIKRRASDEFFSL